MSLNPVKYFFNLHEGCKNWQIYVWSENFYFSLQSWKTQRFAYRVFKLVFSFKNEINFSLFKSFWKEKEKKKKSQNYCESFFFFVNYNRAVSLGLFYKGFSFTCLSKLLCSNTQPAQRHVHPLCLNVTFCCLFPRITNIKCFLWKKFY